MVAAERMSCTMRRTQSCGACDMFRRKTSTPRWISWLSISGESVAGPSVAMILVFRNAAIGFVRFKCRLLSRHSVGSLGMLVFSILGFHGRHSRRNHDCATCLNRGTFCVILMSLLVVADVGQTHKLSQGLAPTAG